MTHWRLPSPSEFAMYAQRTKETILLHFSFLHMPTFRLDMLATCLAFTLCVVGADRSREDRDLVETGPDGAEAGWVFGPMVRSEMTIMIMEVCPETDLGCCKLISPSFSVTKRMTMSDYNLALEQSLLLLQASEILSDKIHERMRAYMFRTTIVNVSSVYAVVVRH
jgi:hypothetical protein